jgi:hypothetical protein
MNKIKFALLISIFAVCSQSVLAQDRAVFYVGGSLGHSVAKEEACSGATMPCDRRDTNWGVQAGLDFNRYIGVEGGYRSLGRVQQQDDLAGNNSQVKVTLSELVLVGSLPVDRLVIYGKFGGYHAKSVLTTTTGSNASATNNQWTAGVGFGYDVFKHLRIRAEYQRYNSVGRSTVGLRSDVETYSLGAVVRF